MQKLTIALGPHLDAQQLGALAAAVKAFAADPSTVHDVQEQLSGIYAAGGPGRKVLESPATRTTALYGVTRRYKRQTASSAAAPSGPSTKSRPSPPPQVPDPKIARMVVERVARTKDMEAFYADPEYAAMLAGAHDDQLSPGFLLHRRRLFGKRRARRR